MGIIERILKGPEKISTLEELAESFRGIEEQILPFGEKEIPKTATIGIEPFSYKEAGREKGWTKISFYNTPISQEEGLVGKKLGLFLVAPEPLKVFPLEFRSDVRDLPVGKIITVDLAGTALKEGTYRIYASSPKNKWLFSVNYKK
jgi:hypothetical protein